MALEEGSIHFVHVIITLAILMFAAKLFAELFHKLKLPIVLGELLAGILVGPFAIGGLVLFEGEPLVMLDETIRDIGGIASHRHLVCSGARDYTKGILERRSSLFYSWNIWSYTSIFCRVRCPNNIRVECTRINVSGYSPYCYKYSNHRSGLDRIRKDADKGSQIDTRRSDSR